MSSSKVTEADPDGAGPLQSPVTTAELDAHGNVVGLVDANGNPSEFAYDEYDRLVLSADGLGNQTTIDYSDSGRVLAWVPCPHRRGGHARTTIQHGHSRCARETMAP